MNTRVEEESMNITGKEENIEINNIKEEEENSSTTEVEENTKINNIRAEEESLEENQDKTIQNNMLNYIKVQKFIHHRTIIITIIIVPLTIITIIKSVNGKKSKEVIKVHKFHKRDNGISMIKKRSHTIMIVRARSTVTIKNNGIRIKENVHGKNNKKRWKR